MSNIDPYSLEERTPAPITPSDKGSFETASELVVGDWANNLPTYQAIPGTLGAFVQMGAGYVNRIRTQGASERFLTPATDGGVNVVARFIYVGAARAALNGFSPTQYTDAMQRRESFGTMSRITHERNDAAVEIERSLGLREGFPADDYLGLYDISVDEGLQVVGYTSNATGKVFQSYEAIRGSARFKAAVRHEEKAEGRYSYEEVRRHYEVADKAQCSGHTSGIVRLTYSALLGLSITDPSAFTATLARVDDIRASVEKAHPAYARKITPPLL